MGDIRDCARQKIFLGQLKGIISDKLSNELKDVAVFRLIVQAFFAKEIHSLFPYWVEKDKLNWIQMNSKFEKMPLKFLLKIVHKIQATME